MDKMEVLKDLKDLPGEQFSYPPPETEMQSTLQSTRLLSNLANQHPSGVRANSGCGGGHVLRCG